MRMTSQREIILKELQNSRQHMSADELYERVKKIMPRISLATVYRNLETLSAAGVIGKRPFQLLMKAGHGVFRVHLPGGEGESFTQLPNLFGKFFRISFNGPYSSLHGLGPVEPVEQLMGSFQHRVHLFGEGLGTEP